MSCCKVGAALRSCSSYTTHLHLDVGIDGIISEIHSRKFEIWLIEWIGERGAYLVSRLHVGFCPGGNDDRLIEMMN